MISRWLYASILGLLLTACGGSSGGSDPQADSGGGARPPVTAPPSDGSPSPSPENPQPPSSGGDGSNDGGDGGEAPSPDPAPAPEPQPPSSGGGDNGGGDSGGDNDGNDTPAPGPLTDIRFENPHEIAADANGNLYVADGENNRDRLRQIAPDGSVTTLLPEGDHTITALAVTPSGEVFYSTAGDSTSGSGLIWQIVDGVPVQVTSEEMAISDFVIDPSNGDLYVGVWTPSGPEVRLVEQNGSVTTLFSIDERSGAPAVMALRDSVLWLAWRDGPYRTKEFRWSRANGLQEVAIDFDYVTGMQATASGIYITGYRGSSANTSVSTSCTVKLLNPDTLELSPVAGAEGEPCHYEADTNDPDRLDLRYTSLTQASDGNLYLTENFHDVIRKITPDGEVSTYAGVHDQPWQ